MDDLSRFRACMNYQPVDRAPFWGGSGWPETRKRWIAEGYDPKRFEPTKIADQRNWFGSWFFPYPTFERKPVDDGAGHLVYVDRDGILVRVRKDEPESSMPQFLKHPVETREDFRRFWRERMTADLPGRLGPDWQDKLRAWRAESKPLVVIAGRWGGFFGPLRNLVGVEKLCTLFYDDPAFVEEMMDADADYLIAMMGPILDTVPIDAFGIWEDMAYKTGPLLSPEMARRYMLPRYKRLVDFLRGRGVPHVGLDSDGHIHSLIPVWMDAGLDFLFPFEVQAGMDVLEVRRRYGKGLRILGGINKRALAQGPAAIDAELNRVRPLIEEGGYIPHLDHSCPPDISYANFCYYLARLAAVCRGRA